MHRVEVDVHGCRRDVFDDEPCPVIDYSTGRRLIQERCRKHDPVPFEDGTGSHCQFCHMVFSWK